jgi:hypothetical protein
MAKLHFLDVVVAKILGKELRGWVFAPPKCNKGKTSA